MINTPYRDIPDTSSDIDPRDIPVRALRNDHGGSCVVASLVGRAGIRRSAWVRRLLELQASEGQRRIVVDLSRLSSMDWWAALMLLWVGRVVGRRGGVLVLAVPQPAVARVLEAAGAPKVVAIYGSVRQVGASMAVRRPLKHAQS
jgi:anti-sigma B factor antagonist